MKDAHKLGCHHIVTDGSGTKAVSVGFDGKVKAWKHEEGKWSEDGEIIDNDAPKKAGQVWAVSMSGDGQYLAGTTHDGRVKVWDLNNGKQKIREFETKGSFGMCVDMVRMILAPTYFSGILTHTPVTRWPLPSQRSRVRQHLRFLHSNVPPTTLSPWAYQACPLGQILSGFDPACSRRRRPYHFYLRSKFW